MIHFEFKPREYVSSVNLETLEKAVNTLEQGHKEAIKMQTELYGAINSLDMDESENGFKEELTNSIQDIVDSTMKDNFENATYAINKLIVQQGNLLKDPLITAKVRANVAHKEYEKVVRGSNLSEDIKEFLLDTNTYRAGSYNEDGTFNLNKDWSPVYTMQDSIDLMAILRQAEKDVSIKQGTFDITSFLDYETNGLTTDYKRSNKLESFATTTTQYNRKTKEDIIKQFWNIFNSNPKYLAAIQQEFDAKKYLYNKYKNLYTDEEFNNSRYKQQFVKYGGQNITSIEEYINSIIDPSAEIMEFNNFARNTSYGKAGEDWKLYMNHRDTKPTINKDKKIKPVKQEDKDDKQPIQF